MIKCPVPSPISVSPGSHLIRQLPKLFDILSQNVLLYVCVLVTQSCPTLCDPMDCSLPGSSVHQILQARILEWVAISSSRDLPNPGIEPRSSALQADSLPAEPPGKYFSMSYIFDPICILYGRKQTSLNPLPQDGSQHFVSEVSPPWLKSDMQEGSRF